jgi:hypothetical protein
MEYRKRRNVREMRKMMNVMNMMNVRECEEVVGSYRKTQEIAAEAQR